MIIAVDFDGTLHMGQFPEIGIPMPYAIEMMRKLKGDEEQVKRLRGMKAKHRYSIKNNNLKQ